jgi:hypothetical protein
VYYQGVTIERIGNALLNLGARIAYCTKDPKVITVEIMSVVNNT